MLAMDFDYIYIFLKLTKLALSSIHVRGWPSFIIILIHEKISIGIIFFLLRLFSEHSPLSFLPLLPFSLFYKWNVFRRGDFALPCCANFWFSLSHIAVQLCHWFSAVRKMHLLYSIPYCLLWVFTFRILSGRVIERQ